ncbi:MAG: four helix bundle protein [Bacteroidales bacterium]
MKIFPFLRNIASIREKMNMENTEKQTIQSLSLEYALEIIKVCRIINGMQEFWLGNQLIRSGTAIGALVKEAQNAESRKDFIHKMKIAAKEAGETEYWLQLCQNSLQIPEASLLLEKNTRIIKILSKIISTSNSRLS